MTMTFTIILRLRVFVQMVGKEEPLKNIEYLSQRFSIFESVRKIFQVGYVLLGYLLLRTSKCT